jgi:hypothetical protein
LLKTIGEILAVGISAFIIERGFASAANRKSGPKAALSMFNKLQRSLKPIIAPILVVHHPEVFGGGLACTSRRTVRLLTNPTL